MQNPDNNHHRRCHSDKEIISSGGHGDETSYTGPLNKRAGGKKSSRVSVPTDIFTTDTAASGDDYVEITLDVRGDSMAVHSVKAAAGGELRDPELTLLARSLEKRSSFPRNASLRIRQVSQEIERLASLTLRPHPQRRLDWTKSAAAQALKGLKFISKTNSSADWAGVEKRFDELTSTTNGLLPRSPFCERVRIPHQKNIRVLASLYGSRQSSPHKLVFGVELDPSSIFNMVSELDSFLILGH